MQIINRHLHAVYCFTSDIDWASEDVLTSFFNMIDQFDIKLTTFVTHKSEVISKQVKEGKIERGIHPNFLTGSSHGEEMNQIIKTCKSFAPEAIGSRSHRAYGETSMFHALKEKHGIKYISNTVTILQENIIPLRHESGLIDFPIFFEYGTHLYNNLDLDIIKYKEYFHSPGLKIISFHPMNFVFNSPTLKYMRNIKDSMSREQYNNIIVKDYFRYIYDRKGIRNTVIDIINFVKRYNYPIISLNDLYKQT